MPLKEREILILRYKSNKIYTTYTHTQISNIHKIYEKNDKILMKEIKKSTEWEIFLCSWIRTLIIVELSGFPIDSKQYELKFPQVISCRYLQIDSKIDMERQWTRIPYTISKKEKILETLIPPNFKTCYKAALIKQYVTGEIMSRSMQQNREPRNRSI